MQSLESPALRKYLKVPDDQFGQRVMMVRPNSVSDGVLRENDVILAIDGADLADDGTIEIRSGERTNWAWAAQRHQIGSTIPLTIWRDGESMEVEITLSQNQHENRLVAAKRFDVKPDFYIFGGLIFAPLSRDYLAAWGNRAPRNLVNLWIPPRMKKPNGNCHYHAHPSAPRQFGLAWSR